MNLTLYEFYLLSPLNAFSAMNAARRGDESARHTLSAVERTLKMINRAPRDKRLRCMCLDCNRRFDAQHCPLAFVIVIPMFPDADHTQMTALGICDACGLADLEGKVRSALFALWPDAQWHEMTFKH